MFEITSEPITNSMTALTNPQAGAIVVFEGRVRNHNDGEEVQSLEYEAYADLAINEGNRLLHEALHQFDVLEAKCVHRVGHLAIGDVAVRVGVAAAHRGEAFRACQFVIDELKQRVPIWKKEHYTSGVTDWIAGETAASKERESQFYARQQRLPQIGHDGQAKLKQARVLVVGAGGLGCPALLYLAGAGVGTIGIIDADRVDISNLHRQIIYNSSEVGLPKAVAAARRLRSYNPFLTVNAYPERLTARNCRQLLANYDLVIDGTDNFRTKFLLNDACVQQGLPLVQASLYQVEGQLQVILPEGPCLRCLWPETPADGCVGTCAEVGVLGATAGILGAHQALEAIKFIVGIDSPARDHLMVYDHLSLTTTPIRRAKNPACPTCGEGAHIGFEIPAYEVDPSEDLSSFVLIDIREDWEQAEREIPGAISLPMSRFAVDGLTPEKDYLLVCAHGVRSAHLAQHLHALGLTNFLSLPGGLDSLA